MVLINKIIQQALTAGYLSIPAQNQIQSLLQKNYDSEDLDAFIILQRAVVAGHIQQESRTCKAGFSSHIQETSSNMRLAYQIASEIAFAAVMTLTMPKNPQDQP